MNKNHLSQMNSFTRAPMWFLLTFFGPRSVILDLFIVNTPCANSLSALGKITLEKNVTVKIN